MCFDNQEENSEILKDLINKGDDKLVFRDEIEKLDELKYLYINDENLYEEYKKDE